MMTESRHPGARAITRRDALKRVLGASIGAGLLLREAAAQNAPAGTIKLVVGGAAGSVPDSLARLASEPLSRQLGQPIVIENRPGAGGITAMQAVIGSAPDGYTIGLATLSQAVFNSYLFPSLPYDPRRDLVPVSMLAASSSVLAAHPSLPASTLAEVVALSQREPGKLLIGVPANGSAPHIAALLLARATGLSATFVHFRSGPDALTGAIRNDVQLLVDGPTLIAPQIEGRTLKCVVALGSHRHEVLNEVPTVAEAGFPAAASDSWMGLVAPRGTPDDVVARLGRASVGLVDDRDYVAALKRLSFVPRSAAPQEFATLIAEEHRRWAPIFADLKLQ